MKKLILAMVFVFATGIMMNANTSNEEITTPTIKEEVIEIVEDFGCASDCVRSSKAIVFEEAAEEGGDASMDDYMLEYGYCYYSNCVN